MKVNESQEKLRTAAIRASGDLGLPLPRLQLTWVQDAEQDQESAGCEGVSRWLCFYDLLIPCDRYDIRNFNQCELPAFTGFRAGFTKVSGEMKLGHLDSPFRDGCHAEWDARLLKLPVYIVNGEQCRMVEPRKTAAPAATT